MPITASKTGTSGKIYESPFVGPINHTIGIPVDLTTMTDDEIDPNGYLKPGIPFGKDGTLIGAAEFVFGVSVEEIKVAADNAAATIAALGTVEVAVATIGMVNRELAEDILGRAYTAAEIAGFDLAGSKLVLTPIL